MRKEEEDNFGGEASTDGDNVSVQTDSEKSESVYSEAIDMENVTLNQRILQQREQAKRGRRKTIMFSKNNTKWSTTVYQRSSNRQNIISDRIAKPKNGAENCKDYNEFWNLLFDQEIRIKIVECTNKQIEEICLIMMAEDKPMQMYHHTTDIYEINAFIGLLYYAGLWKSNHVDVKELWSNTSGYNLYRCVMPKSRFLFLSNCLRFDIIENRLPNDRLSPIRELWNKFIRNCSFYYEPSNDITVDEQLLSFRGRCQFPVYIKSKSDKYGLKIITMNDAQTFYLIHGIPYLGKTGNLAHESSGEFFFKRVTEPIHGTNRSITCDNWFTTMPLMKEMFKDPYKMKITGTIRKNKKEIPNEMKIATKEIPSSRFCHHENITLVSYTPKKNKIVLVVSNKVTTTTIGENNKPEMISYYNKTKGGTDVFDKLCNAYTTVRTTKRWPMRFFFGMLDQARVNARILYTCQHQEDEIPKSLSVQQALKQLAMHLIELNLREKLQNQMLRTDIRKGIQLILGCHVDNEPNAERPQLLKRIRCGLCFYAKDRKTKSQCPSCLRSTCDEHRAYICNDCVGTD
ncbi:piggyBac transposable element-derived protein 4-like [Prorops nasuta]|uniref:piggyBac transposable element-derived protein 4-like n=1 Tax=Prorops nasuta TaxID=863751 RepID=UPI0034CED3B2